MSSNVVIVLSTLLVLSIALGGYLVIGYLRMRDRDLKELNSRKKGK